MVIIMGKCNAFFHYGLSDYSHQYNGLPVDLDLGMVAGWRMTKI